MIFDYALMFSDKQELTATGHSTNTVEVGQGVPGATLMMSLEVTVREESGTSPTLKVELETSDDDVVFAKVLDIPKPAAARVIRANLDNVKLQRYLRLRYVLAGSNPAYNLTAALIKGE